MVLLLDEYIPFEQFYEEYQVVLYLDGEEVVDLDVHVLAFSFFLITLTQSIGELALLRIALIHTLIVIHIGFLLVLWDKQISIPMHQHIFFILFLLSPLQSIKNDHVLLPHVELIVLHCYVVLSLKPA